MSAVDPDFTIDLTGLKCPLPVLRTKKALAELKPGQILLVATTDPGSAIDIPAFAKLSRHELVHMETTARGHKFYLRR